MILVPYEKEHVEKYHGWMQSEEILQTTASEPLTIENEYKMQESWREDEDKLTIGDNIDLEITDIHNLNDKGYCKDCHRHKSKLTNCYHKWIITNQCIIL